MKTSEAAQALGVSENTLRKYSQAVEKAASPAYFPRVKNTRRYRPEDLTEILLAYTINTMVGLLYKLIFFNI